jgi:hypothetical protein
MKGQLSIDYVVALIVFIGFTSYIAFQLLSIMPNYSREVKLNDLRSEAYQISNLLINDYGLIEDGGLFADWERIADDGFVDNTEVQKLKRVGLSLSDETNHLSSEKVDALEKICQRSDWYTHMKMWMDTEYRMSISVNDRLNGVQILECLAQPPGSQSVVRVERTVSFDDGAYGDLVLEMW